MSAHSVSVNATSMKVQGRKCGLLDTVAPARAHYLHQLLAQSSKSEHQHLFITAHPCTDTAQHSTPLVLRVPMSCTYSRSKLHILAPTLLKTDIAYPKY